MWFAARLRAAESPLSAEARLATTQARFAATQVPSREQSLSSAASIAFAGDLTRDGLRGQRQRALARLMLKVAPRDGGGRSM
jgi:hypothetical protein